MLLCINRISGLRSGINAVKQLRLHFQIIACLVKCFIPLREFDDHINIRIDLLGRFHHDLFRDPFLLIQTELRPGSVSLCFHAAFAAAVQEIKIIKNKFVKNLCIQGYGFFEDLHALGIRVAKRHKALIIPCSAGGNPT